MESTVIVVGKIKNINKQYIVVYNPNTKQTFKCKCPFKCSLMETDTIAGKCRIEHITSKSSKSNVKVLEDEYIFLEHPYVKISVDRESIITCLFKCLSNRKNGSTLQENRDVGILGIYNIYDKILLNVPNGKTVNDYLNIRMF